MERWKTEDSLHGLYLISSLGRLKSCKTGRILKLSCNECGYVHVKISIRGLDKDVKIHRLVAKSFIHNPGSKEQVNHKDGDKKNNCVENLEWMSARENTHHALEIGLIKNRLFPNHRKRNGRGISESVREEIREMYEGCGPLKAIAKQFNISLSYVSMIGRGIE